MERLSIVGCGTMGHSIALSAGWAGMDVQVYGVNEQDIETAIRNLQNKLNVMVENDLFSIEESARIFDRITLKTSLEEVVEKATFIIEAIPENIEMKKDLYDQIEKLCSPDTIIASNTSGFTPTALAEKLIQPERFVVTHFWHPAHLIPLVEVVTGERTEEEAVDRSMTLLNKMNKKPILVRKEVLGFIGNRLQYALFREAQSLLDKGVATKEDIDAAVKYSIGRRLPVTGPLMSADLGGLDVFSTISNYLFEDLSNEKMSGKVLTELVEDKKFGDKSGEGFYEWDTQTSADVNAERERLLIHFLKNDEKE